MALTTFQKLYAEQKLCNVFPPGPERDACYIREGYQVAGPNSYVKSTGAQIGPAQVLPFIPVLGEAYSAVSGAVGAIRQPSAPVPTELQTPAPVMMFAPSPPTVTPGVSSSAAIDSRMLWILGGAAVLLLFVMRR